MYNNEILEFASKTTFVRWRNDPIQCKNADKNVTYAIEKAIGENNFNGFTSNDRAREYAMSLEVDNICHALFYNMIQLSEYRRIRNNESLGNCDSDIIVTVESCKNGQISELEELLKSGVIEILNEVSLLNNYPHLSEREREIQQERLAEIRRRKSPKDQRAYEFADSVITAYTDYNIHYGLVSSRNPIQSPYEQMALGKLNQYYITKNVQK